MQGRLRVASIDHVALNVRDLKRSIHFYRNILGLEVIHEMPRLCFLQCGSQMLTLIEGNVDDHTSQEANSLNHLAFKLQAGDVQAVKNALVEYGIEMEGQSGDIYFYDPDGHHLQLLIPEPVESGWLDSAFCIY